MSKLLGIILVSVLILIILTVFISPFVDLEPTVHRVQQWLTAIVATLSAIIFHLSLRMFNLPGTVGLLVPTITPSQWRCVVCLAYCMRC